MTDKELRHLNRSELLQLLISQGEENRHLREQLEEANNKLNERQLIIKNSGSIAEAALQLNGVFEAAEKAAQQYLESVAAMNDESKEIFEEKPSVPLETDSIVHNQSDSDVNSTEVNSADVKDDEYWQEVQKRVQTILKSLE
ncbi:MAG: hypothetical protein IKU10_01005 [Clostridia bacterium]|nr:hypothetical protein [Clostridia bacterium]